MFNINTDPLWSLGVPDFSVPNMSYMKNDSLWSWNTLPVASPTPEIFVNGNKRVLAFAKHTENEEVLVVYAGGELSNARALERFRGYENAETRQTTWETQDTLTFMGEGVLYRHYKGGQYRVIAIAMELEKKESLIIYTDKEGNVWARPLEMFFETVQVAKNEVRRFSLIDEEAVSS